MKQIIEAIKPFSEKFTAQEYAIVLEACAQAIIESYREGSTDVQRIYGLGEFKTTEPCKP
jgi:hypothetical protein